MYLIDTNVLISLTVEERSNHQIANAAVDNLLQKHQQVYVVPQIIAEFWNVCTRPEQDNGYGYSVYEADREVSAFECSFPVLKNLSAIYDVWRELIKRYEVIGKQIHDTRLVAAMQVHGIEQILTFNTKDFQRYEEIQAIHPQTLLNDQGSVEIN